MRWIPEALEVSGLTQHQSTRFQRGRQWRWIGYKRQAAALFLIAPMIAVSMAPPAPPATTCEMIPSTLRLPDCAAAVIAGSNKVTIWPSTPPPIKPEIMLPIIPRSKVGDDLYRVPEIVTRERFPDGGESDSTWRTQEARHVGSDTIAPGF